MIKLKKIQVIIMTAAGYLFCLTDASAVFAGMQVSAGSAHTVGLKSDGDEVPNITESHYGTKTNYEH